MQEGAPTRVRPLGRGQGEESMYVLWMASSTLDAPIRYGYGQELVSRGSLSHTPPKGSFHHQVFLTRARERSTTSSPSVFSSECGLYIPVASQRPPQKSAVDCSAVAIYHTWASSCRTRCMRATVPPPFSCNPWYCPGDPMRSNLIRRTAA